MKKSFKKLLKIIILMLVFVFAVTSCNLPFGSKSDNSNVQTTPNLTLTALFDTSHNIPATITPAPTEAPALPTVALPTNTEVPTATLVPTLAPTPVPPTPEPMIRPGGAFIAQYVSTAPVLDGTYAEWIDKTQKYKLPYRVVGARARRWILRHESRPYGAQQARKLYHAGNRDKETPSASTGWLSASVNNW